MERREKAGVEELHPSESVWHELELVAPCDCSCDGEAKKTALVEAELKIKVG